MARPSNEGLDYFPLDVDYFESMKIMRVSDQFGSDGELAALKLTCWIYRTGYAIEWDDVAERIFARRVMFNPELPIHEIVESLLDVGYFDRGVFQRTGMLTSRGIQKRWAAAQKLSKRPCNIDPELNLLDGENSDSEGILEDSGKLLEDSGNLLENSGKLPEDSGNLPENSQLKKRKEKKSKAITPPKSPPAGEDGVAFDECSSPEEMFTYSEQVCAAWNETFHGTEREVVAVNQPLKQNYRAALIDAHAEGITPDQFRRAFSVLRDTPRLSWQLHSAIKPDNVRMLLTEGENARHVRAAARSGPVIPVHSQTEYATEGEFWGG